MIEPAVLAKSSRAVLTRPVCTIIRSIGGVAAGVLWLVAGLFTGAAARLAQGRSGPPMTSSP